MSSFGEHLKKARKFAGLTQEELADRIGVDGSYVSRLERNIFPPPNRDKVEAMAEVFGFAGKERAAFLSAAQLAGDEEVALLSSHLEGEGEDTRKRAQASLSAVSSLQASLPLSQYRRAKLLKNLSLEQRVAKLVELINAANLSKGQVGVLASLLEALTIQYLTESASQSENTLYTQK